MATTDYRDYFNNRITQELEKGQESGTSSKFEALQQASSEKIASLTLLKTQQLKEEQLAKDSWAGQWDLDPDSFLGSRMNDAASIYSGISRGVGEAVSLIPAASSIADAGSLTQGEYDAYNRHIKGVATPEDMTLLTRKKAFYNENDRPEDKARLQDEADQNPNALTALELFERSQKARTIGRDINESFDRTGVIHQGKREALKADLGDTFQSSWDQTKEGWEGLKKGSVAEGGADMVTGVAKLLFNAGEAAVSHPGAAKEYILENVPQLVVGGVFKFGKYALTAMNAGYAADNYQEGIENYRAENNGALPPAEKRQEMALYAASLLVAEQAGELGQLAAIGKIRKQADLADDAVRTGFKESLKQIGKATGLGVVGEAPTEAWQTFAEGEITGKEASAQDIYEGGVIGGIAGGGLTGGGRAIAEALGATPEKAAAQVQEQNASASLQEAITSGDVSAYTDPSKPSYAPEKAIAALFGHSQLPDTKPEVKAANLVQANEIVAGLEEKRAKAQEAYDTVSPEGVERYKTQLAEAKAANQQEMVSLIEEQLADVAKDPKAATRLQGQLGKLDRQLGSAREALSTFHRESQDKDLDVEAQVAIINAAVDPTDALAAAAPRAAAESVINLSMTIPERLDATLAMEMAENTSNALTVPQRDYLRAFSEARVAENTLKDLGGVSEEIYTGSSKPNGNVGIAQYRGRVAEALAAGNQKQADKHLAGLTAFMKDHQAKAAAAALALQSGLGNQILRTADKKWFVPTQEQRLPNDAAVRKNGGLTINTARLANNIQTEAEALSKAVNELQSAYRMRFNQGASNVQNSPQPQEVQSNGQPATPGVSAPKAGAVAQSTTGGDPGSVASKATVVQPPLPRIQVGTKADGFTNVNAQAFRDRADRANLTVDIESLFAEGKTAKQVEVALGSRLDFIDKAERTSLVIGVRATLGIPSQADVEGQAEFAQWKKDRAARTTVVAEEANASSVKTENSVETKETKNQLQSTQEGTTEAAAQPEPVATKDLAESVEQTTEVIQEETTKVQVDSGTLSTLAGKSPEGTAYRLRNLIADYFTQVADREGDVTSRPLVAVKDFLSLIAQSNSNVLEYLQFDVLSDVQLEVLGTFKSKAQAWQDTIKKNLSKGKNPEFYFNDLMQFLVQGEGKNLDLEENVKTAMSYAAFSYTAENASRSMFNTDEEINAILERDETALVSKQERAVLGLVGTRQNVVANALGQRAVQALGLKVRKDAPKDLLPKLESHLGAHIFKMMMDQGILERVTVPGSVMASLTGSSETNASASFQFLKLARDESNQLNPQAEEIFKASMGTQGVLDKLFSVESALKEPSLEPIPFTQNKTRNTNQDVPEKLAKILEAKNAEANFVRQDMWQLVTQLDEAVTLQLAGVEEVSDETTHAANRPSIQAKNDGLKRELQRFVGFVSGMQDNTAALFFEHSVWKQQRVGIATNVVNPQSSKIHRHMLFKQAWESVVKRDDLDNFRLRVLEGLGVKTDKQSNAKSLASYDTVVGAPEIQAAVAVLRQAIFEGGITAEEQQTLLAGVKKGGANFHTLDVLVALAHEAQAKAEGKDSFTVQMMGEVDGVTNGPMLSHLLLGAAATVKDLFALLNRGGFFEEGNEHSQYNLWREAAGHLDLYETTALHMTQAVQRMLDKDSKVGVTLSAIYAFTGTLADKDGSVAKAGRNIIKTPLTAMVFGSSVGKAIDSMANGFIESIYSSIEDVAAGKADLKTVTDDINTLLIMGRGPSIQKMSVKELMEYEFTEGQVKALKKSFGDTLGKAVKQTMEEDFASFIEQRKQFNLAAQMTFDLYDAAYTGLRDTMIEELVKSGEIATNTKGTPIHDLTPAQEAELRKRLRKLTPIMHTLLSKESDSLAAGLHISKSGRKLSTRSTHEGEIKFGTPFADNNASSTKTRSYETVDTAPGVAMAPMSVHSTDSAISHNAADGNPVLNIHDAHGSGLATFEQTARNLNKATWEAMLNYSPAGEMFSALSRTVQGLASLVQEKNLPPAVLQNLADTLAAFELKNEIGLQDMVNNTKEMSYRADDLKLQALGLMTSIDQYALQGGNYSVTEANRAETATKRAVLSKGLSEAETDALAVIKSALEGHKAVAETQVADPEMDTSLAQSEVLQIPAVQAMQLLEHGSTDTALPEAIRSQMEEVLSKMATGAVSLKEAVLDVLNKIDAANLVQLLSQRYNAIPKNAWGDRGTPVIRSDLDLVAFFEANPDANAQRVLQGLHRKLSQASESRSKAFNLKLLKLLSKTVNPALKVRYVTPATAEGQVLAKPATKARGWYVSKGTQEEIYVLSPDFRHSGLTVETLLHELTHSALARTVDSATGETLELVNELEVLRSRAATYIAEKGLKRFAPAVANVQELIAWGMTNLEFQKNVLNMVQVETKTGSNTLITGMKKFIDTIVGLLFKDSSKSQQEQDINGMSVLISNVSGLFYQAAQTKGQADLVLNQDTTVVDAINVYSTLDIHEALGDGTIEPSFDAHLRGLLGGIVEKLHGPFGSFKETLMPNQASTPLDVWLKALNTGEAPFASQVLANLAVTDQEAFAIEQVEATVRAALNGNESLTKLAYSELSKLYTEAYKLLKPSDFNSQAEYDFIFKLDSNNGDRSDYLARFAALGLAHQGFNKLLQVATERDTRRLVDADSFADRIQLIFQRILEFFQAKITHTFAGQLADEKLVALVDQLVDIEAKKRFTLARRATESSLLAPVEEGIKNASEAMRKKVAELAGTDFVKNNTSGFVRGAGGAAHTIATEQVDYFLDGMTILRDRHFKGIPGVVAGLINDVRGPLKEFQALLREAKNHERERKAIISNRSNLALSTFIDKGKNLSKEAKASISAVLMRSGAHNLVGHFSLAEIENLVSNRASLLTAIKTFEAKLASPMRNQYIEQANILGHYKATGKVSGLLMMNAHLIARMAGSRHESQVTAAQATQSEEVIKVLATLYALRYTETKELDRAKEIIRTENHRSDGNGVEFVLELHKRLEQESLEKLFKGNPALMVHGFTPEITNQNTDIKIANEATGKDLIAQGYSKGAVVANDLADPDQLVKNIYVLRDGGLAPWLTGVISTSSLKAKGTKQHDGYVNVNTVGGLHNAILQATLTNQLIANLPVNADPHRDLSKETENHLAPIYNERGQIVNWRYLMQESTKNDLLERDNNFARLLGVIAGSVYDKQTAPAQNKKAIAALHEQFNSGYAGRTDSYVLVGPKSTNPEMRQIWQLLPDATKRDVRAIWGFDGMMVRKDSLDIMFGYRKLSMADALRNDPAALGAVQKIFRDWFNIYARSRGMDEKEADNHAKRIGIALTKGERAWQELVSETKDILVVKTGLVMMGNIYSNLSLLWMNDIPWKDIAHHHLVALKGATAYQKDSTELAKYQTLLDTGYTQGNVDEINRNIIRLKDALSRNPVAKLIDAGLMPTIVEDIADDGDLYSYKSAFARSTEKLTSKLHPNIRAAGRVLYMTHDTKMYQGLSRITQLSDFVARYTLYQHVISRKDNPLSEKDAVQEASDAFVNYDIPMHRMVQYTDDMGITMFTKYFLRIQRVLLKLGKEHPARVLMTLSLGNFLDLGPIVLEGSGLTRIGNNPFGVGAFNFPGALDELATVNSAMSVFK